MRTRSVLPFGSVMLRLTLLLVLVSTAFAAPTQAQADLPSPPGQIKSLPTDAAAIYLQAGTFIPAAGQGPNVPAELGIEGLPSSQAGQYIVQFIGPVQEAWKEQVEGAGGAIFDYVPDFAFIVRMDDAAHTAVMALPQVAWVGPYQPAYKLSPDLAGRTGILDLVVQTFPGESTAAVASDIAPAIVPAETGSESEAGGLLRMQIDASRLDELARIPAVRWIEPFYERVLFNDVARSSGITGAETAWSSLGLYGQGQIVAVADTGLDSGSLGTLHQDFGGSPTGCSGTSRIIATYALGRSNNWSDSCRAGSVNEGGHGTHVSGSVLGNGCQSGSNGLPDYAGSYAGLAPQAGLVMQSVMASNCGLGGLPTDLNTLFSQARNAGARIHTNSWGSAVAGQYTTDSRNTDLFTWNNKDATILFAAGNEGIDANSDGFIDLDSISAPGTAKNAITVGASENNRTTGGYNPGGACSTWGTCWPSDYPAEPIKSDPLSNNPGGIVAFSSRGPTDDGRIKPDVVAPGSNILSTKSQAQYVSGGWGAGPNGYYQYMGGTSMATPLTAGAVALIRQFYTDIKGITPSGALLKATLINSAADLYPGQYTNPLEHNPRLPNFAQGWGRVNVANATDNTHAWQDIADAGGLATGGSQSYSYESCGASTFKATLVWTDYPGATLAAKELVNDLDLVVTAPDGATTYRGNVFSNGWSATGGSADRTNNVESVYLQSPAAGAWTITVSGYNVPNGSSGKQGYALVVDRPGFMGCNDFTVDATPAALDICAPDDAVYTVNVGKLGSFSGVVTLGASGTPAGTTASFSVNPVTSPGSSTLTVGNTAAAAAGAYNIAITGVSGALNHAASLTLNLATDLPAAATPTAPTDGSTGLATTPTFTWNAATGATGYDIQVATDPAFVSLVASASGLTGTGFTPLSPLSGGTPYYWRVRAVNACGTGSFSPLAAFITSSVATASFCRSPGLSIPDNNTTGVSDDQTIATTGVLSDLDVSVQAKHTWVGDLVFKVQSVSTGISAIIIDRPGAPASASGCSNNHINATLDDQAALPVENQCATSTATNPPPYAISGSFAPNNPLSLFAGQALATAWRITVSDHAAQDTGTLTEWCLIATYGTTSTAADYSDLPASYGVAWHTGSGALKLGAKWDADSGFGAGADNSRDDDGVSFPNPLVAGAGGMLRLNVQGTPSNGRWARAWFDWNNDGAFGVGELAFDGAVAGGINDLSITLPAHVTDAVHYRVRLYDSSSAPAGGAWGGTTGGEVEDGLSPCVASAPITGITISDLGNDQVQLAWTAPGGRRALPGVARTE